MTLTIILLFFFYVIFVTLLTIGWDKVMAARFLSGPASSPLVSVVIPVRNEGSGIARLLEDILRQSCQNFEVIVVDDHSTDKTAEIVSALASQDPRILLVTSRGEGKKAALTTGINVSGGETIVTTDGDCRFGEDWLKTMLKYFQTDTVKMVFGGVKLEGSSFFSIVQSHEFLSLTGTAAATLWYRFPSMCNGANLAFRKSVFLEVGGYANNFHIPSGDDEFLMRKIFRAYPDGIRFAADSAAVATTSTSKNVTDFVHQRVRWAGKWRHDVSSWNAGLAVFVFCFQLSVLFLPVGIWIGWISPALMLLYFFKFIAEAIFLKKVAAFVRLPWSWPSFVFLQFSYPVYAVWVGLISTFSSFEWKGRKLKSFTISAVKK